MCEVKTVTDAVVDYYNDLDKDWSVASRINTEDLTPEVNAIASKLSQETMKRYYGSGLLVPEVVRGAKILDLGSGSGSAVFLYSKLVGPNGYVVGIDFAHKLVEKARQESEYHWKMWGYDQPNFEFIAESIENISKIGMPKESFDVVVSNGVLGVCKNKEKFIERAYEMLKPNGMFLLGDSFAERSQRKEKAECNQKLTCQCFTGQLAWKELPPLVTSKGFTSPCLISCGSIGLTDEFKEKLDNNYVCAEYRMFKLAPNHHKQGARSVIYKGSIPFYEKSLPFDINTVFKTGEAVNIDGELATNLMNSDFADHFTFGDVTDHPCNKSIPNPFEILNQREINGNSPPPRYVN